MEEVAPILTDLSRLHSTHVAQGCSTRLFLSISDVALGPEFIKVFSADVCDIVKLLKLVTIGRRVYEGRQPYHVCCTPLLPFRA